MGNLADRQVLLLLHIQFRPNIYGMSESDVRPSLVKKKNEMDHTVELSK